MGDVVLSYLGGTILCLTMEMPVSALQKLMLRHARINKTETTSEKSLKTVNYDECTVVNDKQGGICTRI